MHTFSSILFAFSALAYIMLPSENHKVFYPLSENPTMHTLGSAAPVSMETQAPNEGFSSPVLSPLTSRGSLHKQLSGKEEKRTRLESPEYKTLALRYAASACLFVFLPQSGTTVWSHYIRERLMLEQHRYSHKVAKEALTREVLAGSFKIWTTEKMSQS